MSCDCNTLVIGEAGAPGPQGLSGINGTNGTNGLNAFTTTSASFVQPSVGSPVTFSVVENRWIAVGQTVYISQAGFYTVSALGGSPSFSSVTANLVSTDGISVGGTVTSGRQVSPSASAVYSAPLASLTVTTGGVSNLDGPVTINNSGTSSAHLRVKSDNDNELLYCDAASGRVGISTLAPETTLHVDGTFKVGTLAAPADAVFTKGAIFNSEQSGSGTDGDFLIKTKNEPDTFFVDASANAVGIGTNSPSKLLDVDGAAEMNTLLVNPGGVAANPSFQVYGTNSTRPITVLSTNTPFNGVGIFKTTPTVELDVVGAATITGATILGSTLAVTGNVTVGSNVLKVDAAGTFVGINKTTPTVALDVVGAATVTGATNLSSTLAVTGNVTVGSNVLKVNSAGPYVGVNKANPTVALDVVGAATVTGATNLGSTLDVTGATTLDSTLDVTGDVIVNIDTLVVDTSSSFVGINKTTPAVDLDVDGSVQATDYRISTGSGAAKLTGLYFATGSGHTLTGPVSGLTANLSNTFTDTVTGCLVGDFVIGSYTTVPTTTNFTTDIVFVCKVTATDTVSVTYTNTDASGTDTGFTNSVTLKYLVIRAAAS
jgi:hypothetical protein